MKIKHIKQSNKKRRKYAKFFVFTIISSIPSAKNT